MASVKPQEENIQTLQLLLQRLPGCHTRISRNALLTLVYLEAIPIATILTYSILKKKYFYRADILDVVHDACTKLILQYAREDFIMKNVRSYLYLMVLGTLYPHSEKTYSKYTVSFPETDDALPEELISSTRLYCDDVNMEESMYEDLDLYHCTDIFVNIFRTESNLKKAVKSVTGLLPKSFFYRHWGAIYSLWYFSKENELLLGRDIDEW